MLSQLDPYAASYPVVERLCWAEVLPGLVFCFRKHIGRLGDGHHVFNDKGTVWTVVAKTWHAPTHDSYGQRYLLLGSGGTLVWHRDELGWVQRIVDPGGEQRKARLRAEARAEEEKATLQDTALALAC